MVVSSRCFAQFCLLLLSAATYSRAASTNRTIDDQNGDSVTGVVPSYSPAASWEQGSTCDGCFVKLDPSQTFDGTWHDSTHTPGDPEPRVITAQFTGTAVYVYHVIANTVPYTTTYTDLTFLLDGKQVGTYVHVPTDSTDFQYDVPVYTNSDLANTAHTLVIEATGDTNSSLVLFDYIVYTFTEDDPPPSTTTTSTSTTSTSTFATSPTTSSTATSQTTTQASTSSQSSPSSISTSSNITSTNLDGSSTNPPVPSSPTGTTSQTASADNVSSKSSVPVGAIAGGVVGGVIVIAVLAGLAACLIRRRNALQQQPPAEILHPEMFDGSTGMASAPLGFATMYSDDPVGQGEIGSHSRLTAAAASSSSPSIPAATTSSEYSAADVSGLGLSSTELLRSQSSQHYTNNITDSSSSFRPIPDVPVSPTTTSNYTTTTTSLPYLVGPPQPRLVPLRLVDEKPPIVLSSPPPEPPPPEPQPAPAIRKLPVPPVPSSAQSIPVLSRTPTSRSGTVSRLQTQVAVLQDEIARLREVQDMQELLGEAPPRYDETRA